MILQWQPALPCAGASATVIRWMAPRDVRFLHARPARTGAFARPAQRPIRLHRPRRTARRRWITSHSGAWLVNHPPATFGAIHQALDRLRCSPSDQVGAGRPAAEPADHALGAEAIRVCPAAKPATTSWSVWVRTRRWLAAGWAERALARIRRAGLAGALVGARSEATQHRSLERWRLQQGRPQAARQIK